MKTFEINTTKDVAAFFFYLVFEKRIILHPDDPFEWYKNIATDEPTFTKTEAKLYDILMEECFDVCCKEATDIYEIAQRILSLFAYADGNEKMAEFYAR